MLTRKQAYAIIVPWMRKANINWYDSFTHDILNDLEKAGAFKPEEKPTAAGAVCRRCEGSGRVQNGNLFCPVCDGSGVSPNFNRNAPVQAANAEKTFDNIAKLFEDFVDKTGIKDFNLKRPRPYDNATLTVEEVVFLRELKEAYERPTQPESAKAIEKLKKKYRGKNRN